jgi:excisionase family DNA binding protein
MTPTEIITYMDQMIASMKPEERIVLATALLPRITQLLLEGLPGAPGVPNSSDRNLNVKEAAERLGVSTRYLYTHARKLPFSVRMGSRVLFSSSGIDAWLKSRRGR